MLNRTLIAASLLIVPLMASGNQGSSKAGFERLQANVENSKANLEDYQKNLGIVDENLNETAKAKSMAEKNRAEVIALVQANKAALTKLTKQEQELVKVTKDEQDKLAAEEKELKNLEAMIAKIKENKAVREGNIVHYQQQMQQLQTEKKAWSQREQELNGQQTRANQKVRDIAKTEAEWKNKKKGYEAEISRWSKEVTKQEQSLSQFETLANAK